MSLYAKRLEKSRFTWPTPSDGVLEISAAQLGYMSDEFTGEIRVIPGAQRLPDNVAHLHFCRSQRPRFVISIAVMNADLGGPLDDIDALKAALLCERAPMQKVATQRDVRTAELAVAGPRRRKIWP